MTEAEKQRIFLERATSVLAERVSQLDVIVQQRIYASLERLYFEKEDPLQTIDNEFEGYYGFNAKAQSYCIVGQQASITN